MAHVFEFFLQLCGEVLMGRAAPSQARPLWLRLVLVAAGLLLAVIAALLLTGLVAMGVGLVQGLGK